MVTNVKPELKEKYKPWLCIISGVWFFFITMLIDENQVFDPPL